jgi:arylsulfatase A-like enzyme
MLSSSLLLLALATLAAAAPAARQAEPPSQRFPNVVILTIDTLRADRLSSYGYRRPTSPNVDRLLASGVRFTQARTVEPLTNPALCSMFTSLYPHEHGATRNGLRLRPGLPSVAGVLQRRGYRTAAFVGNWTLKDRISGLGEHFERYDEVFSRKRWFGVFKSESTAEDLSDAALEWLGDTQGSRRPFLLWVHYVEPHAPYRLQEGFARPLGVPPSGNASRSDRYDTEIAFADHHLGRVLAFFDRDPALKANTLFIFTADHGESLGEHGFWGHGRNLHDPGLHIPLGLSWAGKIRPGTTLDAPALNLDVAPTILGLAGLPAPPGFRGYDWAPVLQGAPPPRDRITWFQAHKGAVLSTQEANGARRKGLLEIGMVTEKRKEIFRLTERQLLLYDLAADPAETRSFAKGRIKLSQQLQGWLETVQKGLTASDRLGPVEVDPENVERLRALGYAH